MPELIDINKFTRLFRRTVSASGLTGSIVTLALGRLGPRKIRVLTHVTVENKTSDYTKCRLAINAGGIIHYLDELTTIVSDELAVSRSDILLGEGDAFVSELTGTTTGDELIMTCIGWEIQI